MDDQASCSDVLRDVWLFLDNELDPERRAAVQRHLDSCSPCLAEAGLDAKLKELLARQCGGDHAPERLRHKITASLVARSNVAGTTMRSTTVSRSTSVSTDGRVTQVFHARSVRTDIRSLPPEE